MKINTLKTISLLVGFPLALALVAGTGCSKRLSIVKKDETPATAPADQGTLDDGRAGLSGGGNAGDIVIVEDLPAVQENDLSAGTFPTAGTPTQEVRDVFFDFDQAAISDAAAEILKENAGWISAHPEAAVRIEGTADERGTNEYNLALGEKRAQAVKRYLETLGVPEGRVETVSFGEEKSFCSEATEACWSRNRRGHFVVLGAPVLGRGN
ncbi:MAG: peptidoglycan-associated lipoprotein Pal [Nitrospirae bacterium]|nr:peptidoglycan-associated lipoprotein Pal [Nitrospirota bacterium]